MKQKLLDGKQVTTFAINRPDVKLYCEAAKHYDYIWFEMQHSTMSFKDIEDMIAACPRPVAMPMIRVPDETEGNIQKATDIGALGVVGRRRAQPPPGTSCSRTDLSYLVVKLDDAVRKGVRRQQPQWHIAMSGSD